MQDPEVTDGRFRRADRPVPCRLGSRPTMRPCQTASPAAAEPTSETLAIDHSAGTAIAFDFVKRR